MLAPRSLITLFSARRRFVVSLRARISLMQECAKLTCKRLGHKEPQYITTKTEVVAVCPRCGDSIKTVPLAA